MHIVWQQIPVKGRGGGPFLEADQPGQAPPWHGLRCEHHGGRRSEWTPFVVEEERRDGQIRQALLFRLPPIRSCCIESEFLRAAWWHDVDWAIRLWGEAGDGVLADDLARDRAAMTADLREVIRKPTPAGLRDFAAFRARREVEDQARDEANGTFWDRQVRAHRPDARAAPERSPTGFFAVLNLRPTATLDQVKARHRELVKRHHPDRGGDPAQFRLVQAAYEQAIAAITRRSDE